MVWDSAAVTQNHFTIQSMIKLSATFSYFQKGHSTLNTQCALLASHGTAKKVVMAKEKSNRVFFLCKTLFLSVYCHFLRWVCKKKQTIIYSTFSLTTVDYFSLSSNIGFINTFCSFLQVFKKFFWESNCANMISKHDESSM